MKNSFKRFFSLALAIMLFVCNIFVCFVSYGADDKKQIQSTIDNSFSIKSETKKVINIVYDDSGSMVNTSENDADSGFTANWAYAKYSLEVFVALLNKDDILNVYALSTDGKGVTYTIKGSDKADAVEKIHEEFKNGDSSMSTSFKTLKKAKSDLNSAKYKDYTKWMIVLSDGDFRKSNDDTTLVKGVDKVLSSYGKDLGGNLIYIPLGKSAKAFRSNSFITQVASDGDKLLDEIQKASETVYSTRNGQTQTNSSFKINISTKRILIFAQGKNVAIKDINVDGGKISENVSVKYTEKGNAVDYTKKSKDAKQTFKGKEAKFKTDTNLQGVVVTVEAAGDYIAPGTATINFDGAVPSKYVVYYEPMVTACYSFSQKGKDGKLKELFSSEKLSEGGSLNPGTYVLKAYIGDANIVDKKGKHKNVTDAKDIQPVSYDIVLSGSAIPGGKKVYSKNQLKKGVEVKLQKGTIKCQPIATILPYKSKANGLETMKTSFESLVIKDTYTLKIDYELPKTSFTCFLPKRVNFYLHSLKKHNPKNEDMIKAVVTCYDKNGNKVKITEKQWSQIDEEYIQAHIDNDSTRIGTYKVKMGKIEDGSPSFYMMPSYYGDKNGIINRNRTTHSNFMHYKTMCYVRNEITINASKELAYSTLIAQDDEKSVEYEIAICWFHSLILAIFVFVMAGYFIKFRLPSFLVARKFKQGTLKNLTSKEINRRRQFEDIELDPDDSLRIQRFWKSLLIPYYPQQGRIIFGNTDAKSYFCDVDYRIEARSFFGNSFVCTTAQSDFDSLKHSADQLVYNNDATKGDYNVEDKYFSVTDSSTTSTKKRKQKYKFKSVVFRFGGYNDDTYKDYTGFFRNK